MSWANVRGAIVTALEALTPTSYVNDPYTNVDEGFAEEQGRLRGFDVRLRGGPNQVGQIINGSTWRWLTDFEVVVFYPRIHSRAEMEQVLDEDIRQIQQTLLQKGNHHANLEGIAPNGEGLADAGVDYDEVGNAIVSVAFTAHHL